MTGSGRSLGAITDVVANPANDLWVATDAEGSRDVVPALRRVVVEVDADGTTIIVRDIAGLTAPDDDAGASDAKVPQAGSSLAACGST